MRDAPSVPDGVGGNRRFAVTGFKGVERAEQQSQTASPKICHVHTSFRQIGFTKSCIPKTRENLNNQIVGNAYMLYLANERLLSGNEWLRRSSKLPYKHIRLLKR